MREDLREGEGTLSPLNYILFFAYTNLTSLLNGKESVAIQGLERTPLPQMVKMFLAGKFVLISFEILKNEGKFVLH